MHCAYLLWLHIFPLLQEKIVSRQRGEWRGGSSTGLGMLEAANGHSQTSSLSKKKKRGVHELNQNRRYKEL
jgi:hypothetical protein